MVLPANDTVRFAESDPDFKCKEFDLDSNESTHRSLPMLFSAAQDRTDEVMLHLYELFAELARLHSCGRDRRLRLE